MSFLRLASRLCPETYSPDRPGLPIPLRSHVSVLAPLCPADPLWFRPQIRSYPSFIRRHLFPHGQSRSVRPWRFSPPPARGVRVRRTLVVLGPEGLWGHEGRSAHFPNRPVSQKSGFSQNRPKRPIRRTSPGFPSPELSRPHDTPPISRRNDTQPKQCPIHPNCRSTDMTNAEPTISNTNVAYRYRQCHQSTGTHPNPLPFAHNASRISHACPSQIADIHATCRPIIAQMQSIRQTHTAEQIRGQTPLQATRCAGSHQLPTIPIPNFS